MFGRFLRAVDGADGPGRVTRARQVPVPPRAVPSLAREVLVATTDPEKGTPWPTVDWAIAGALMLELAHEGRLSVDGTGKDTRVTVSDPTPLGDPLLDFSMEMLDIGGPARRASRKAQALRVVDRLTAQLVDDGVLVEESRKRFGVFAVDRFVPTPAAGRDEVVARIRSVLLGESVPDERTSLLVAALGICIPVKLFVPREQKKEAERRSAEILERIGDDERALVEAVGVALLDGNDMSSSL